VGLQLRNKVPKRRVKAKLRDDRKPADRVNETWAMDPSGRSPRTGFVHDQLATGRKIRVLTIVDIFSRFSPAVDARFNYRGEDVVATLERVCKSVGCPRAIRVDQGTEFVSRDLDLWAYQKGVVLDFSRPGKPTDNSFIESFNGKFRAECLNAHWFMSLDDARAKTEDWCKDYNEVRPHSAIGNKPRISLMNGFTADRAVQL
jgi:putative transposase